MNAELRAEARGDILDGASFFDGQRDGLGDYFIDCIFNNLRELETQAVLHEVVFGLHRKLANRFPFAIYYLTKVVRTNVARSLLATDSHR